MIDYDLCMEHYVHANLHDMHAGMWGCQVDWNDYYEENKDWLDPTLFSVVAVKIAASARDYVKAGWLSCPSSCDIEKDDESTCACKSAIDTVKDIADVDKLSEKDVYDFTRSYWTGICAGSYGNREVVYTDYKSSDCLPYDISKEHLDSLNRLILKTVLFPGNYGDMATGAAANDPLFWVMHQIFDKAAHALRLSPLYNKGGFSWHQEDGDDVDSFGLGWTSVTPFKYKDFEPLIGHHDLEDTEGFLTNKMLWSLLSPDSESVPYVYDQLTHWGGCIFDPMDTVSHSELSGGL